MESELPNFSDESTTNVQGSTLLALRWGGWVSNLQKKALRNSWMARPGATKVGQVHSWFGNIYQTNIEKHVPFSLDKHPSLRWSMNRARLSNSLEHTWQWKTPGGGWLLEVTVTALTQVTGSVGGGDSSILGLSYAGCLWLVLSAIATNTVKTPCNGNYRKVSRWSRLCWWFGPT